QRRQDDPDPPRAGDRVGGAGDAAQGSPRPGDVQEAQGLSRRGSSARRPEARAAGRGRTREQVRSPMSAASASTYYGTGRRKTSVARVWLRPGSGAIRVNQRPFEDYFPRETLRMIICQPLQLTNTLGQFDATINVGGGGPTGQAGAVRHGIARALLEFD